MNANAVISNVIKYPYMFCVSVCPNMFIVMIFPSKNAKSIIAAANIIEAAAMNSPLNVDFDDSLCIFPFFEYLFRKLLNSSPYVATPMLPSKRLATNKYGCFITTANDSNIKLNPNSSPDMLITFFEISLFSVISFMNVDISVFRNDFIPLVSPIKKNDAPVNENSMLMNCVDENPYPILSR